MPGKSHDGQTRPASRGGRVQAKEVDVFTDDFIPSTSPFATVRGVFAAGDVAPALLPIEFLFSHSLPFLDGVQTHKTNVRGGGVARERPVVVGFGRRNPNEKQSTRKGKRNK